MISSIETKFHDRYLFHYFLSIFERQKVWQFPEILGDFLGFRCLKNECEFSKANLKQLQTI